MDTMSKCEFLNFGLYCSIHLLWLLVLPLFNPTVCSISAVTLSTLKGGCGGSCWRGNVCFGRNIYFQNKFPSQNLRFLNNYFPWDGFPPPRSIPAWIYFLWKRDFSGLRILPWKLVNLQLGLKRLFWLFSPLFLGGISLPHRDGAAMGHCAAAMSPLPTSVGKLVHFGTHPA